MVIKRCVYSIFVLLFCMNGLIAQYFSGPDTGSIAGGAVISTFSIDYRNQLPQSPKLRNPFRIKYDPVPWDDEYNKIKPTAPLYSNEITDIILPTNKLNGDSAAAVIIDFVGNEETNSIPPDPIMAAGPDHIIACVNTMFIIFDKQGNELFRSNADPWFTNVVPVPEAFDPCIIYDHFEERWVMLWDSQPTGTTDAWYLISVSDDSDPMGTWYNYAFPSNKNGSTPTSFWADYPKLGYDANAVYMSGRMFGITGGFYYSHIRWVSKSALYGANGGSVLYTDIWDLRDPQYTSSKVDGPPVPAVHLDYSDTGYFIVDNDNFSTSTYVTLWKIQDPNGLPIITAVNIPVTATQNPYNGQQLGGGQAIDVGRRTYRNAAYQDGALWTCANVRGTGVSTFARYLKIDVGTNTALEDYSIGATGFYYLYPAIMVDQYNNMTMVYTRCGYTEYAGFGYTSRRDTDPAGYLSPTRFVKEGEANYVKTYSGTRNRWGDYMGIAQDPDNRNVVWSLVEYAESPANTWGTWIAAFTHLYTVSGIVKDAVTQNPINLATLEIVENSYVFQTDSTGAFSFGALDSIVTVNLSAFGYYDTTRTFTLTQSVPEVVDIEMETLPEYTISGQVKNTNGEGLQATLEFYTDEYPGQGPYHTAITDTNGNYNIFTLPGNYDIYIYPDLPYNIEVILDTTHGFNPLVIEVVLDTTEVLLIDDDYFSGMSNEDNVENYYIDALFQQSGGHKFNFYDIASMGFPQILRSAHIDKIIWFTGSRTDATLADSTLDLLRNYLDDGGKLFMSGQNLITSNQNDSLFSEYAKISLFDDSSGQVRVYNLPGDPITGDFLQINVDGEEGANNQVSQDIINVNSGAEPIFRYWPRMANRYAASRTESEEKEYKMVFLAFGFEAITDLSPINSPELRANILEKILDWFDQPIVDGLEETESLMPLVYELKQNYPNPFNPQTSIKYSIAKAGKVKLVVYDVLGKEVAELVNETKKAGAYNIVFDGSKYASGLYFYRLQSGDSSTGSGQRFIQTRKMLIVK